MNLAVNDESYFQVKAKANEAIAKISKLLTTDSYGKQFQLVINEFMEHSEKFKLKTSPKIPDGSPIGSDICNYNSN